jgi:glycosyltransferase involved in cell wall biosynthesis
MNFNNKTVALSQANLLFREKKYPKAIDFYRSLLRKNTYFVYQENLLRALKKYSNNISTGKNNYKKRKPRCSLCFITAGIMGPSTGGGIATCFLNMVKTVSKISSVDVTVVYMAHPYYGNGNYEFWHEYFSAEYGIQFIVLNKNTRNYGSEEMNRSFTISEYLSTTDGLYDTVVFHDLMGLGYYSLLLKRYGLSLRFTRIVVSAHGNHELSYFFGSKKIAKWTDRAAMFMERSSVQLADVVTTPSKYYANWLKERYNAANCVCMPNIIKAGKDAVLDASPTFNNTNLTLYFFGRIERLKGIDVFIDAVKILKNKFDTLNIVFAGNITKIDGLDARDYISSKLSETKCNYEFIINTTPTTLFKIYNNRGGVFVFPSLGETSSCVVVEAILHNVLFVASDIPGIVELIDNKFHDEVLFETGNPKSLADKVTAITKTRVRPQLSFDITKNETNWVEFLCDLQFPTITDDSFSNISKPQPLVTIVVPTCNRPSLLETTLYTLSTQRYSKIEIIVVDDNSTDWRLNEDICFSKRVKYVHLEERRFKGAACNEAVKYSDGEYICFFDDDDLAYPWMIDCYIGVFNRNPELDVLSCFADCFEHENINADSVAPVEYVSLALGGTLETNILANFFGKGTFIIKADKFKKVGGYQTDNCTTPMVDYRFYIRAALNGLNISIIPKSLYKYRKNSPRSLFYENKDNKRLMFLAKSGIESEFISKYGYAVGKTVSQVIWNLSLPPYE